MTAALKALAEKRLVNYAPYELATLTEEGRQIAERVEHDHEVIRRFLKEVLLVGDDAAEENACRMEHVMDKGVLDRLVVFAKYVRDCPRSERDCFSRYAGNVNRAVISGSSAARPSNSSRILGSSSPSHCRIGSSDSLVSHSQS